ncbi:hypothetical protein [Flavobacterium notoginsengisoli]|uniref:hypothetical protein n=1 Tax=Flavobacterium notoginsengisoli TaxID=1478199 RepID=UPI0036397C5A
MYKKFITSILFCIFSLSVFGNNISKSTKDTIQNEKKCLSENIKLKTDRIEKDRKFIFWRLPHRKITITDRVINTDGKIIVKKRTIHICSMDACDDIKFRRIKIIGNEIYIFKYNRDHYKTAIIKRYNSCGKYLGKKKWDEDKSFEDY